MKKITCFVFLQLLTVFGFAQNVGIGTNTPDASALTHINTGNSTSKGLLVTGNYNETSTVPDLGSGSRMMFYPGKGAFRAGTINFNTWDNVNVGKVSAALGFNTIASGIASTALGYETKASSGASTALGYYTNATAFASTTMGHSTVASAEAATAIGNNTYATGNTSTAMGYYTNAAGYGSTAMGAYTQAKGNASGAMGYHTISKGFASTVLGTYNDSILSQDQIDFANNTPLLIVGNGSYDSRSNALTVFKSGNIGLQNNNAPDAPLSFGKALGEKVSFYTNSATQKYGIGILGANTFSAMRIYAPSQADVISFGYGSMESFTENMSIDGLGNLRVSNSVIFPFAFSPSDERLKHDIVTIEDPLNKLMQLRGVNYQFNEGTVAGVVLPHGQQVGLLAQDVEKVLPEAVTIIDKDGDYRGVDYQKVIPLLVEAIKAQQKTAMEQKALIEKQQKQIDILMSGYQKN